MRLRRAVVLAATLLVLRLAVADDLVKVNPNALRPTQSDLGSAEVALRAQMLREASPDPDKLDEMLRERASIGVKGPGGEIYLIDGHHIARAAIDAGIGLVYVDIKKDWSDLSQKKFWEKMKDNDWVYLRTQAGKKIDPEDLPQSLKDCGDDPYRSLAWMVRISKGYGKSNKPFQEFSWADFFRKNLPLKGTLDTRALIRAVPKAVKLAVSSEAKELLGYREGSKAEDVCLEDVFGSIADKLDISPEALRKLVVEVSD